MFAEFIISFGEKAGLIKSSEVAEVLLCWQVLSNS
jgi:hypothetical protein